MVPLPSDVAERVQVMVLPVPLLTAAENVTDPPLHIFAAGAVIVPQVGAATAVTEVETDDDAHPLEEVTEKDIVAVPVPVAETTPVDELTVILALPLVLVQVPDTGTRMMTTPEPPAAPPPPPPPVLAVPATLPLPPLLLPPVP